MSLAFSLKLSDSDDAFNAAPAKTVVAVSMLSPVVLDALHARDLQNRLVQAYSDTAIDEKLPIRLRLAIIAGAASSLWALIGLILYAVF